MTLKDILNINSDQFSGMSNRELSKILKTMVDASNKRIKRIEKAGLGYASNAVSARRTNSGRVKKFSAKLPSKYTVPKLNPSLRGKTRDRAKARIKRIERERNRELLDRIAQNRSFLTSPSSTMAGARRNASRIARDIGASSYDELSRAQQNKFWKAYNELKRKYPDLVRGDKNKYMGLRSELFEFMVRKTKTGRYRLQSVEKSVDALFNSLDTNYRRQQRNIANDENSPLPLAGEDGIDSQEDEGDLILWN